MPLTRISLLRGRTPSELRAIADGVQEALVEAYDAPPNDRFQIIEQREPDEIVFSRDFLGIERSDGLVIIQIIAGKWRGDDAKRALFRSITDRLVADPGVRSEDVQVILTSNDRPDWSFGNGLASYLPAEDA